MSGFGPETDFDNWSLLLSLPYENVEMYNPIFTDFLHLLNNYCKFGKLPNELEKYTEEFAKSLLPNVVTNILGIKETNMEYQHFFLDFLKSLTYHLIQGIINKNQDMWELITKIFLSDNSIFIKSDSFNSFCFSLIDTGIINELIQYLLQDKPKLSNFYGHYILVIILSSIQIERISQYMKESLTILLTFFESLSKDELDKMTSIPSFLPSQFFFIMKFTISHLSDLDQNTEKYYHIILSLIIRCFQNSKLVSDLDIFEVFESMLENFNKNYQRKWIESNNLFNTLLDFSISEEQYDSYSRCVDMICHIIEPTFEHLDILVSKISKSQNKPELLNCYLNLLSDTILPSLKEELLDQFIKLVLTKFENEKIFLMILEHCISIIGHHDNPSYIKAVHYLLKSSCHNSILKLAKTPNLSPIFTQIIIFHCLTNLSKEINITLLQTLVENQNLESSIVNLIISELSNIRETVLSSPISTRSYPLTQSPARSTRYSPFPQSSKNSFEKRVNHQQQLNEELAFIDKRKTKTEVNSNVIEKENLINKVETNRSFQLKNSAMNDEDKIPIPCLNDYDETKKVETSTPLKRIPKNPLANISPLFNILTFYMLKSKHILNKDQFEQLYPNLNDDGWSFLAKCATQRQDLFIDNDALLYFFEQLDSFDFTQSRTEFLFFIRQLILRIGILEKNITVFPNDNHNYQIESFTHLKALHYLFEILKRAMIKEISDSAKSILLNDFIQKIHYSKDQTMQQVVQFIMNEIGSSIKSSSICVELLIDFILTYESVIGINDFGLSRHKNIKTKSRIISFLILNTNDSINLDIPIEYTIGQISEKISFYLKLSANSISLTYKDQIIDNDMLDLSLQEIDEILEEKENTDENYYGKNEKNIETIDNEYGSSTRGGEEEEEKIIEIYVEIIQNELKDYKIEDMPSYQLSQILKNPLSYLKTENTNVAKIHYDFLNLLPNVPEITKDSITSLIENNLNFPFCISYLLEIAYEFEDNPTLDDFLLYSITNGTFPYRSLPQALILFQSSNFKKILNSETFFNVLFSKLVAHNYDLSVDENNYIQSTITSFIAFYVKQNENNSINIIKNILQPDVLLKLSETVILEISNIFMSLSSKSQELIYKALIPNLSILKSNIDLISPFFFLISGTINQNGSFNEIIDFSIEYAKSLSENVDNAVFYKSFSSLIVLFIENNANIYKYVDIPLIFMNHLIYENDQKLQITLIYIIKSFLISNSEIEPKINEIIQPLIQEPINEWIFNSEENIRDSYNITRINIPSYINVIIQSLFQNHYIRKFILEKNENERLLQDLQKIFAQMLFTESKYVTNEAVNNLINSISPEKLNHFNNNPIEFYSYLSKNIGNKMMNGKYETIQINNLKIISRETHNFDYINLNSLKHKCLEDALDEFLEPSNNLLNRFSTIPNQIFFSLVDSLKIDSLSPHYFEFPYNVDFNNALSDSIKEDDEFNDFIYNLQAIVICDGIQNNKLHYSLMINQNSQFFIINDNEIECVGSFEESRSFCFGDDKSDFPFTCGLIYSMPQSNDFDQSIKIPNQIQKYVIDENKKFRRKQFLLSPHVSKFILSLSESQILIPYIFNIFLHSDDTLSETDLQYILKNLNQINIIKGWNSFFSSKNKFDQFLECLEKTSPHLYDFISSLVSQYFSSNQDVKAVKSFINSWIEEIDSVKKQIHQYPHLFDLYLIPFYCAIQSDFISVKKNEYLLQTRLLTLLLDIFHSSDLVKWEKIDFKRFFVILETFISEISEPEVTMLITLAKFIMQSTESISSFINFITKFDIFMNDDNIYLNQLCETVFSDIQDENILKTFILLILQDPNENVEIKFNYMRNLLPNHDLLFVSAIFDQLITEIELTSNPENLRNTFMFRIYSEHSETIFFQFLTNPNNELRLYSELSINIIEHSFIPNWNISSQFAEFFFESEKLQISLKSITTLLSAVNKISTNQFNFIDICSQKLDSFIEIIEEAILNLDQIIQPIGCEFQFCSYLRLMQSIIIHTSEQEIIEQIKGMLIDFIQKYLIFRRKDDGNILECERTLILLEENGTVFDSVFLDNVIDLIFPISTQSNKFGQESFKLAIQILLPLFVQNENLLNLTLDNGDFVESIVHYFIGFEKGDDGSFDNNITSIICNDFLWILLYQYWINVKNQKEYYNPLFIKSIKKAFDDFPFKDLSHPFFDVGLANLVEKPFSSDELIGIETLMKCWEEQIDCDDIINQLFS